ncbi:MAG TPA: type IV toxin-antitoxin system AbiEi family antitoxin [Chthoniobacterales bacterium]|nr:type IV toxin-antitoxin system AbiEi family antitoxin [Chthoniobacterales bacterium]
MTPAGIGLRNRAAVDAIHRAFAKPFSVREASQELKLSNARTRKLLSHLATGGWLSRIRRDLYSPVPLGATSPAEWRADSWVVAATTFAPAHIGGWTACEYWHFTDQLFRDIVVMTSRQIRSRIVEIQGTRFRLKAISAKKKFGTKAVWRGPTKVEVTDPSRTIVDILNDPTIGGGIRHIAEVLVAYFESEHRDENILLDYIERVGNRTVYKRLGYLAETLRISTPRVIQTCREKISAGLSALDPSVRAPGIITKRWNLRVNAVIMPETKS